MVDLKCTTNAIKNISTVLIDSPVSVKGRGGNGWGKFLMHGTLNKMALHIVPLSTSAITIGAPAAPSPPVPAELAGVSTDLPIGAAGRDVLGIYAELVPTESEAIHPALPAYGAARLTEASRARCTDPNRPAPVYSLPAKRMLCPEPWSLFELQSGGECCPPTTISSADDLRELYYYFAKDRIRRIEVREEGQEDESGETGDSLDSPEYYWKYWDKYPMGMLLRILVPIHRGVNFAVFDVVRFSKSDDLPVKFTPVDRDRLNWLVALDRGESNENVINKFLNRSDGDYYSLHLTRFDHVNSPKYFLQHSMADMFTIAPALEFYGRPELLGMVRAELKRRSDASEAIRSRTHYGFFPSSYSSSSFSSSSSSSSSSFSSSSSSGSSTSMKRHREFEELETRPEMEELFGAPVPPTKQVSYGGGGGGGRSPSRSFPRTPPPPPPPSSSSFYDGWSVRM